MNRLAIEARRTKVMELLLEGLTQDQIAKKLDDISVDTIKRDMDAIRPRIEQMLNERWSRAIGRMAQAPLISYMPATCIHEVTLDALCSDCQRLSELFYKVPSMRLCMGVWTPFLIDQALRLENLDLTPE